MQRDLNRKYLLFTFVAVTLLFSVANLVNFGGGIAVSCAKSLNRWGGLKGWKVGEGITSGRFVSFMKIQLQN